MTGRPKPRPLVVFELTIADADRLVAFVDGFTNTRARRMRAELRVRIGDALRIPARNRDQLDCLESEHVFVVFKPGSGLCRDDFTDPRPLLRQALVAACAAFETYLGDKAMSKVGPLLRDESSLTRRLRELPLTLSDWMKIDLYERKRWGLREYVVEPSVRKMASTAPNQLGALLSLLGVDDWTRKVDGHRKVAAGHTVKELDRITLRRNRIAHEADRIGRGRAALTKDEVCGDIAMLKSVVAAIEEIL